MPGTGIITTTDYEIDVQGGHANQAGLVSELLASAVTVLNTSRRVRAHSQHQYYGDGVYRPYRPPTSLPRAKSAAQPLFQ